MPAQSVTDSRPRKRCPLLSPAETWTENFESRQATRKHFYNNWLFTLSSHKKSKPTSSVLLFSNTQVFVFEDQVVLCKCLLVSSTVCVATKHGLVIATPTVVSSKNRRAKHNQLLSETTPTLLIYRQLWQEMFNITAVDQYFTNKMAELDINHNRSVNVIIIIIIDLLQRKQHVKSSQTSKSPLYNSNFTFFQFLWSLWPPRVLVFKICRWSQAWPNDLVSHIDPR